MSPDPDGATASDVVRTPIGRPLAAVSLSLTAAVFPVFLVGALSTRMRDDLGRPGSASLAVTAFFVGSGLAAVPMGRIADRIGARRALRAGVTISALASLAVAGPVGTWWQAAGVLFVAGSGVGLVDTGGARAFTESVPARRHGLAFGVKEASVPAATMLAGLSIPLLAERAGWQAAFLLAAALPLVAWAVVTDGRSPDWAAATSPRSVEEPPGTGRAPRAGPMPRRVLLLFAAGVALGTGAATAAATLFVPAFEARGWSEPNAGLLLAVASSASIVTRVVLGTLSDRRPGASWIAMGALMLVGAAGALALAASGTGVLGASGAVLVIGAGWGWTGLAFQSAVRADPTAPAAAAGVVLAGLSMGGAAGPAAFAALSSWASFTVAWSMAAAAFLVGSLAVLLPRTQLPNA